MPNAAAIPTIQANGASHRHRHRRQSHAASFQQVLAQAQRTAARPHVVHAVLQTPMAQPASPSPALPAAADAALTQAMQRENVPESWRAGLSFIMAHESGGQVGARSPVHSARGLYQLTRANWHLNPRGAASFGNAVEEAQGGIRYIKARYGSADQAARFWQQHRWY